MVERPIHKLIIYVLYYDPALASSLDGLGSSLGRNGSVKATSNNSEEESYKFIG